MTELSETHDHPASRTSSEVAPRRRPQLAAYIGLIPASLVAFIAYLGTMLWTIGISFTDSRMLPSSKLIGSAQYLRLFGTDRWSTALVNMAIFGVAMIALTLVTGFLLAVALDQRVRGEGVFRAIFLYPYAMSFIVTGLIWQWILNPTMGLQKVANDLGLLWLRLDWIAHGETALYCIIFVAIWHASGLVMAIMLAGLRGIDPDLWKATRIEGIKPWRVYLHIVIPMMRGSFISAAVLLSLSVVKLYELVVAMTGGGPGLATDVPALFIMDNLFQRHNIGLAGAAATIVLLLVLCLLIPWLYIEYFRRPTAGHVR